MKKLLILLLALLMLLTPLTSCKKDEETDDGSVSTSGDGGAMTESVLPDMDYGGRTVTLLGLTGNTMIAGTDDDAQLISESLAKRTAYVQDRYNVVMELAAVPDGQDYSALSNSYLSGLRSYDIVAPHPTKFIAAMMTSGMMQDLKDVDYIDTSKPWWNQSQVKNFTVNGKLFFGVSDFNLNKRGMSVTLINRTLYDNMQLEKDLYDVIFDGEWTVEYMQQLALASYDDSLAEPKYGYAINTNGIYGFYFSCGGTLLQPDNEGEYYFKYDVDKTQSIVEAVYDLVNGPQTLQEAYYNSGFATSKTWTSFKAERIMMMGFDLGSFATLLKDVTFETAFAPSAKLNAEDDYRIICGSGFVGIPNDATDISCSALITEAYSEHSYYNFKEDYLDNYMAYRVSADDNDRKVLEIILDNTFYDMGMTFADSGRSAALANKLLYTVIVEDISRNCSSYIANNEEAIRKDFDKILSEIY
ncbi:MAG: hypothetical protein IJZ83_03185 [Clostridia bacterium]|nr:hypothetical protein [Clostridia bacterium]